MPIGLRGTQWNPHWIEYILSSYMISHRNHPWVQTLAATTWVQSFEGVTNTGERFSNENRPFRTPSRGKVLFEVKVLVVQSCLTLCEPMDCSSPGSSVHGILQAGMLEWVATSFKGRLMKCKSHIQKEVELRVEGEKILLFSQSIKAPLSFLSFLPGPLINSITFTASLIHLPQCPDTLMLVVQSLSHVQLSLTPWTTACQASQSFTLSQTLLRFMFTELVKLSNHPTLSMPKFGSIKQLTFFFFLPILLQSWVLLEKSHNFIYW